MASRGFRWIAILPFLAGAARAEEETRTPERWQVLRPAWRTLRVQEGWTLYFRPWAKTGRDPHPYVLAATDGMRKANVALPVRPEELGRYVTSASLSTSEGALEAVRFFEPGRLVADADAARRVVEEARRLAPTLVKPAKFEFPAEADAAGDAAPSARREEDGAFLVRFLALETDLRIALVRVTGRVDPKAGSVRIDRRVLVQGPPTFRGLCLTGEDPERVLAEEAVRAADVDRVRRALRAALDPRRTRDRVRALAKPGVTMEAIRAALGEPDDDVGSGIHVWVYALEEGAALVGEAGRLHYMDLVTPVPGSPFGGPETSERLHPAPD